VPDRSAEFRPEGDGFIYLGKSPKQPTQVEGLDDRSRFNQLVWAELAGEGGASAINTADRPRWGRGFLGVQLVQVVNRFISSSPAARDALLDVGVTIGPTSTGATGWLIVNEQNGVIEEGSKGLALIKRDLRVLSLLAELAEDEQTAQKFVDAQFEQLRAARKSGAAGASDAQVKVLMGSWDERFVRFAAHAIHQGATTWDKYVAISPPTREGLIRRWGEDWGKLQTKDAIPKFVTATPRDLGALFCQPGTVREMRSFAKATTASRGGTGLGAEVLGPAGPLPPEYTGGATPTTPSQFTGNIFYGDINGPKVGKDPVNWFRLSP
jgi:hypothetical protein